MTFGGDLMVDGYNEEMTSSAEFFFKKWGGVCSLPNRKSRVYSVQREVKGVF